MELSDYLGGHAYFATVAQGFSPRSLQGLRLASVSPIRGEWEIAPCVEDWHVPPYARREGGTKASVQLWPFPNVSTQWAEQELVRLGVVHLVGLEAFRLLVVDLPEVRWSGGNCLRFL